MMALTIDADLINDFEDIDPKVIAYCITLHQKELKRFDQLSDYYDGKHAILERKLDGENSKNVKVMVNNAKVVTDMMVGFSGGNPVGYTAAKDKDIDPVLDVYEEIDIATHDIEMLKDLSVFGVAYELHYIRIKPEQEDLLDGEAPEIEPRIKAVDPRGIFLVTDDTLERNKLFACHYYKKYGLEGEVSGYQVDVYTRKRLTKYKADDLSLSDGKYVKAPPIETFYNSVPVIEIRNNEEKQGDFEQQISLIDAYNLLQSDRIADKEAFIDSILFLYGFAIEEDEDGKPKPLVKNGVISAPSTGGEDGAKAEWLTKAFVEKDVQVLSKSIEDDIHKTTYVPNLNDEKFGGTISGEAMKYKLFGLLQLLATKSRYLSKGLRERLELTSTLLNVKTGATVDPKGAKISIKANLPINTAEVINMIKSSLEFIPLLTSLGWLPDIDDPQETLEMLYAQKAMEAELAAKAMGMASNDTIPPEEDEEEEVTANEEEEV